MSLTLTGFGGTERAAAAGPITLYPSMFTNANAFYAATLAVAGVDRQSMVSSFPSPVQIASTAIRQSVIAGGTVVNEM
jgi:hypothetical protein